MKVFIQFLCSGIILQLQDYLVFKDFIEFAFKSSWHGDFGRSSPITLSTFSADFSLVKVSLSNSLNLILSFQMIFSQGNLFYLAFHKWLQKNLISFKSPSVSVVIYYSYNFLFCTFLVFLLFPKLVTESFILLYFFHKTMFYLLEIVFLHFY